MDFGRRGFLSMLGGLIMGKIVGPVESPADDPQVFAQVTRPDFPKTPVRNVYLPLEMICASTAKVLEEELKWLRLRHRVVPDGWVDRMWYSQKYDYDPMALSRKVHYDLECLRREQYFIDIPDVLVERGDLNAAKVIVRSSAHNLAETIIRSIRIRGGAEEMLIEKMPVVEHADKCVVATCEERGFSVRGIRHYDIRDNRMVTRVDVTFGLSG